MLSDRQIVKDTNKIQNPSTFIFTDDRDLEGSSQLEKDTSLIFIIDPDVVDETSVMLRIVKGRNTGRTVIDGKFVGRTLTFQF